MVTCLLTQPQPRVAALCEQVRAAGLAAVPVGFIRLEPIDGAAVRLAATDFECFDRIIFVSPSAVWFARQAIGLMVQSRRPRIAAIGAGTEAALRAQQPDIQALRPSESPYDAEHLAAMPEMRAEHNRSMLVVRADRGRDDWIEDYRRQGVEMTVLALYQSISIEPEPSAVASLMALAQQKARALTIVSSLGLAERLINWHPGCLPGARPESVESMLRWLRRQPVFVSHPRIARRLTDGGFDSTILPPDDHSLLDAAIQWAHENA